MATAPKGYKNVRIHNRPTIVPNDHARHVKWVFEEINEGVLAPYQIRKGVNKKGFKVSRSYFRTMIRNPLYCGRIFIPAYKEEEAHYDLSPIRVTKVTLTGMEKKIPLKMLILIYL